MNLPFFCVAFSKRLAARPGKLLTLKTNLFQDLFEGDTPIAAIKPPKHSVNNAVTGRYEETLSRFEKMSKRFGLAGIKTIHVQRIELIPKRLDLVQFNVEDLNAALIDVVIQIDVLTFAIDFAEIRFTDNSTR
jgi:hypothetical protein